LRSFLIIPLIWRGGCEADGVVVIATVGRTNTEPLVFVGAGFQPARMKAKRLFATVGRNPASRRDAKLCSNAMTHQSLFTHPFRDATNHLLVASLRDAIIRWCGSFCYRALHPLRDATITTFGRNNSLATYGGKKRHRIAACGKTPRLLRRHPSNRGE